MVEGFLRELYGPDAPQPNGPARETYIIPTSFLAATPYGQSNSDVGTRMLVVPGHTVGLMVSKGDLARMSRAMRGYQKGQIRRNHPDFDTYSPEQKKEVKDRLVSIATSKKRGQQAMVVLSCERVDDFPEVTELLCAAAGIELYLPRSTPLGDLAQRVQEADFRRRLDDARARLEGGPAALGADVVDITPRHEPGPATPEEPVMDRMRASA